MKCPLCFAMDSRIRHAIDAYEYLTCRACGVTFISPFPEPDEIQSWYRDARYFNQEAGNRGYVEYGAQQRGLARTFVRRNRWMGISSFWKGRRVLEIGCALGFYPEILHGIPGLEYTGVDLNRYAVEEVKKKGFRAFRGGIDDLPGTDEFDVIVFFDVLEHIPDPLSFLDAVRSRLRRDGQILLTTPSTRSLVSRISGAKWVSASRTTHQESASRPTAKTVDPAVEDDAKRRYA